MKKVLLVAFVVMAFVAMGAFAAFACDGNNASTASAKSSCSASKTSSKLASADGSASCSASKTSSKLASSSISSKSSCSAKNSTTSAKLASAVCTPENMEACLAYAKANHAKACKFGTDCELTSMSISGMTCGGCENNVKAAFMKVDGVNEVLEVCHKAGFAVVCTDSKKASNEVLMNAVSAKGFNAEIIPAVATISTDSKLTKTNSTGKACCASKKTTNTKASAEGTE